MRRQLLCWPLGLALGLAFAFLAALNWAGAIPVHARPLVPDAASIATPIQSTTVVTNFTAKAALSRGQIDLGWAYTGKAFRNQFLVERSNNLSTWTPVSACSLYYSAKSTAYRCSDTGLTSNRLYYYRACLPATGVRTCPSTSIRASTKAP
jgi:hypothetical protein